MKRHDIIFELNSTEKIVLNLDVPVHNLDCYSEAAIYFVGNAQYLLAKDSVQFKLQGLRGILEKALGDRLLLHTSITRDIGYMYNEYRQGKPDFVYEFDPVVKYDAWVGYKYLLWGMQEIAWIYTNENNDIIFELTSCFPGDIINPDQDELVSPEDIANSLWYEAWIKKYEPLLIRKMSRDIVQQWLDQANELINMIDHNTQVMLTNKKLI